MREKCTVDIGKLIRSAGTKIPPVGYENTVYYRKNKPSVKLNSNGVKYTLKSNNS